MYQSGGPSGARGKPLVCSSCSTVTTSFPLVPNSGMISATRTDGSSRSSPMSNQIALAISAFVHEKMT